MTAPRIVIAKNGPILYSETFIRAHQDRLRTVVGTLLVDYERAAWDDQDASPDPFYARLADAASMLVRGYRWQGKTPFRIAKALRGRNADVVLAEYGTAGVVVRHGCRRADVPLVVHFHGFDASKTEVIERFETEYRAMFGQAAAVVAVSRAMRDQILSLGCPREKVLLNVYGVDVSIDDRRRSMRDRRGSSTPTFLAVGRFVEKKAQHLTLFAFARCLQSFPEARLRCVGDGPLLRMCQELAEQLGIRHAVEFLGAQGHDVVLAEMRRADAFVQHSVVAQTGDSEGTPVAILEASAAGLPVIATRHAGIPDVVDHEVTGWLVDEHDVEGMAEAMQRVAADSDTANRLGAAGRDFVGDRFSTDASLGRLNRLLSGVVAGKCVDTVQQLNEEVESSLVPPPSSPGRVTLSDERVCHE